MLEDGTTGLASQRNATAAVNVCLETRNVNESTNAVKTCNFSFKKSDTQMLREQHFHLFNRSQVTLLTIFAISAYRGLT